MKKLIILDRDGVINYESTEYIKTPAEWQAIPGSLQAITRLNQSGYQVVIVTNQSGVGRGYYDLDTLSRIHKKLKNALAEVGGHVDDIFFCPHRPDENCICRKPKPYFFYEIKKKYQVNLADIFFIGDSLTDVEVARLVGCQPILVLTGKGQKTLNDNPQLKEIVIFPDLSQAVDHILRST